MRKILRKIKRFFSQSFGTAADKLYWRHRHLFDRNWAKSYISTSSISEPSRAFLVEKILKHEPAKSVLEFGCASGPNLYLLAKKLPNAKIFGIDISSKAINEGKIFFTKEKINNVFLSAGDSLKDFGDKSIDIVFSDAALIYIGPEKIEGIIREFERVAKKAIILLELTTGENSPIYDDNWIYNYELIFKNISKDLDIVLSALPKEIANGNWKKHGKIIEALIDKK